MTTDVGQTTEATATAASAAIEPKNADIPVVVKRTRKPRAAKPARKARIAAPFLILWESEGGTLSIVEDLAIGSTYEAACKVLATLPSGKYRIVRDYGVKTVTVTQVPKVQVT